MGEEVKKNFTNRPLQCFIYQSKIDGKHNNKKKNNHRCPGKLFKARPFNPSQFKSHFTQKLLHVFHYGYLGHKNLLAGQEGFEPPTRRFGVCCSTVGATGLHLLTLFLYAPYACDTPGNACSASNHRFCACALQLGCNFYRGTFHMLNAKRLYLLPYSFFLAPTFGARDRS